MNPCRELLRFQPIFQQRVWGGRRLETVLGRQLPDASAPYGEAWDLVDRPEAQSIVSSGALGGTSLHDLWRKHRVEVFGTPYREHPAARFPLLIKVLDCADDLSIQVHPPAAVAGALGGESKTEMWYVAAADPGARLYAGLKAGVTREAFEDALRDGSVAKCVHALEPQTGQAMHVPSGRVHALGAGLLVYEVQENSDTTYRVFDWNRPGLDGRPRELHIEQSLRSIDFADTEPKMTQGIGLLSDCAEFRVSHVRTGHRPSHEGVFRLITPITHVTWGGADLSPGDLTLCPAQARTALGEPVGEWLEIEIPTARQEV